MKRCPKCHTSYDDTWGICLKDKASLLDIGGPSGIIHQGSEGFDPKKFVKAVAWGSILYEVISIFFRKNGAPNFAALTFSEFGIPTNWTVNWFLSIFVLVLSFGLIFSRRWAYSTAAVWHLIKLIVWIKILIGFVLATFDSTAQLKVQMPAMVVRSTPLSYSL